MKGKVHSYFWCWSIYELSENICFKFYSVVCWWNIRCWRTCGEPDLNFVFLKNTKSPHKIIQALIPRSFDMSWCEIQLNIFFRIFVDDLVHIFLQIFWTVGEIDIDLFENKYKFTFKNFLLPRLSIFLSCPEYKQTVNIFLEFYSAVLLMKYFWSLSEPVKNRTLILIQKKYKIVP